MTERPALDLTDTLEGMARAFLDRPSSISHDDVAWMDLLDRRAEEAVRLVGLRMTCGSDGRSIGIGVPGAPAVHVVIGRRGPAATRATVFAPVLSHLAAVLRGDLPHGDAGVRPLPTPCRAVLNHDDLDPDAAAAIAQAAGRLVVRIGDRKHVAGLEPCRRKGMRLRDGARPTLEWANLRFDLSRQPWIHVTGGKIVVHRHLPFLVTAALPGRFEIEGAAATQFGVVVTIREHGVQEPEFLEENGMTDTRGAHPLRISTIRRADGHVSSVLVGVDHLAPDRDIVGRAGAAVEALVSGDADLKGQARYLYNAVQGQFAIIAHDHAPGSSRRMRTSWTATHDVEMTLGAEAA